MTPTDSPAEIEELVKVFEEAHGWQRTDARQKLAKRGFSSPARASAYAKAMDTAKMVQEYKELIAETGTEVSVLLTKHLFPKAEEALAAHQQAGR